MKLSRPKRVLAIIALALAAYFLIHQIQIRFPFREHKMNEYTEHLQTVCVGRFLIDLPAQATIVQRSQKINDVEIEVVEKRYAAWTTFEQGAREYERKLRAMPHPKQQTLFKETLRFTPDSFTFVYLEDDKTSTVYKVETWLWRDKKQLRLMGWAHDKHYSKGVERSRATLAALQLRDNAAIPTTPGACGDGTLFTGKEFRMENFSLTIGLREFPGFRLGLDTKSQAKPYEEKGLIERFTQSISMPDVAGRVNIDVMRSASLTVNGQKAEEYVVAASNVEKTYPGRDLRGELEIYPTANSLAQPFMLYAGFSTTHDGSNKPHPRVMDDDVFLSIWDKALKSIRLRPGAV